MGESEMQINVPQDTTENGQSPTVNSDTKPSETASSISNPGFNAVGFKGSWLPVPFLAEPSETKSSQKSIAPEVPVEVSEDPSTLSTATPKDSECAANPEKKETNATPTLTNSTSPSKSPSHKISSRSEAAARSKSPSKKNKSRSKSRSPSERKSRKTRTRSKRSKSPKKKRSRSHSQGRRRKSRSPDRSRRSNSRSRRRSRSGSRWGRDFGSRTLNQRDRWKREPSRSPVLILRKNRSESSTRRSTSKTPPRLTELGMKKRR